jgi:hypothetical protein
MPRDESKTVTAGRIAGLLLAVHATLLAYGAYVHSPTYNEPGHLVAGISYCQFGRFDVYKVNPPLVRYVAAIPVLLSGCKTDWKSFYDGPGARPEMGLGADFCNANGFRTCWLMTLARWGCVPFSLVGGYFVFRWGRDLYGPAAGLISLALWCFCPNIIAHGQLITSDAAATSVGVVACYSFWRWLKMPTWRGTIVSGIVLGIAELAKTTLVIFYPLWPLLWIAYRWSDRKQLTRKQWQKEFGMLITRMCIGIYVINLGYGFEGSCTQLGDFTFVSKLLADTETTESWESSVAVGDNRFKNSLLASLPVPLPKSYILGIDLQRRDFEEYYTDFYLGGEWSKTGWWYYYLYALGIKVPIGTWILLVFASLARVGNRAKLSVPLKDEMILLAPSAVILVFVSSQNMSEHMRYVLPIFPFFYIWIGRVVAGTDFFISRKGDSGQARYSLSFQEGDGIIEALKKRTHAFHLIVAICLLSTIASSLWCYPHSLSYFNELVGGPRHGAKHLLHSNIDWGQDLLKLKWWLDEHPEARPITIKCFGIVTPKHLGIDYSELDQEFDVTPDDTNRTLPNISPGWYALSMNTIYGYGPQHGESNPFSRFKTIRPIATIGYSICLFYVSEQDVLNDS